jgi:DNA-binding response OmpR family regulator
VPTSGGSFVNRPTRGDRPLVLVVQGDQLMGRALGKLLRLRGFDVTAPSTATDVRGLICRDQPSAAIVDLGLPRHAAVDVVASMPRSAPVLMLSRSGRDGHELERLRPRSRLVPKPCSLVLLIETLEGMLDPRRPEDAGSTFRA